MSQSGIQQNISVGFFADGFFCEEVFYEPVVEICNKAVVIKNPGNARVFVHYSQPALVLRKRNPVEDKYPHPHKQSNTKRSNPLDSQFD